jgi:hypothetical protein
MEMISVSSYLLIKVINLPERKGIAYDKNEGRTRQSEEKSQEFSGN